jgi:Double zinc ribbon
MSSSKSPTSAEVKVPCIECGRECPDGLRYCLYCGGKTLEIDKPLMPMNPHCVECGEVDELNITFCVACGAKLLYAYDGTGSTPVVAPGAGARSGSGASGSPGAAAGSSGAAASGARKGGKFRRNTGFNWTVELTSPAGRDASKIPVLPQSGDALKIPGGPARQQASSAGSPVLMSIASGVAVGLLVVGALYGTGFLPDLFDRLTWPKSGLVVYCPMVDSNPLSGASGVPAAGGIGGGNGASKGTAQSSTGDGSGSTKTASGSSDASSDTTGDSSGDSGAASVSPGDDNKQGSTSGSDDDNKPAGSGSAGENSNYETVNSDSASSTKGSDHPEGGGSWQLSVENLANHQLTISPLTPPRSLLGRRVPGCLILKDLAAGNYMLRIRRAGSATTFGMVTLVADKPTVIGYPGGMKLPI